MKSISVVIITKNEENMIANAIGSVPFAKEVIVVDSGSSDNTIEISKRESAKVVETKTGSFADWRNLGLSECQGEWVLYLDADERVTPKLASEIEETLRFTSNTAFRIPRNNVHFGRWMQHGGWEQDQLSRLFLRTALKKWEGKVHEHAVISGATGQLKEPLIHLTHRNLADGLKKSIVWTDIEAHLLFEDKAPPVTQMTILRKTLMEFVRRYFIRKGYKDGMEGFVESTQQAVNRFFVYGRLWELQQKPSLEEKYSRFEKEILKMWNSKSRNS